MHDGCYKDIHKFLKKREEFFNKEINNFKKKEQALLKKLEKLEPLKALEPPKEEVKLIVKDKKDKNSKIKGKEEKKTKQKWQKKKLSLKSLIFARKLEKEST